MAGSRTKDNCFRMKLIFGGIGELNKKKKLESSLFQNTSSNIIIRRYTCILKFLGATVARKQC